MAFTMACPNFKKGRKMAFDPLGVKWIFRRGVTISIQVLNNTVYYLIFQFF
jgi:hypothetical protein